MNTNDNIFGQSIDLSARFHKVMINTKFPKMSKTVKGLVKDIEIKNRSEVGKSLKETGPILYADSPLWDAVKKAKNAVVSTHNKMTSVWDDSGWRLLSTAKWNEYHNTIQPLINAFNNAADALAADFDNMVIASQSRLADLFAPEDYPRTATEFRACFVIKPNRESVPKLDDAKRLGTVLPVEEIEEMKRDMEAAYRDNLERINTQNWELLYTHTSKLANSLVNWSQGNQKSIKKTLLEEIEKACQFCTQFNASNDPKLAAMVEDIRNNLLTVDMDTIRENPDVAKTVIAAASNARDKAMTGMNNIRGFMGSVN